MSKKKIHKPVMKDKYYVGQDPEKMVGGWGKPTLAKAIKHAEEILATEPRRTSIRIVKVVRIVRRAVVPAIIEEVE